MIYLKQYHIFKQLSKSFILSSEVGRSVMSSPLGIKIYRSLLKKATAIEAKQMQGYLCRSQPAKRGYSKELRSILIDELEPDGNVNLLCLIKRLARISKNNNLGIGFEASRHMQSLSTIELNVPKIFDEGDVVMHVLGEVGVVIGRRPSCTMPQSWIENIYSSVDHPLLKQPWYEVALDKQHGDFVTHTPGALLTIISSPIESRFLQSEGWIFDYLQGRYVQTKVLPSTC